MIEAEAIDWLISQGVSRETMDRLAAFRDFLADEGGRQNLVSARSMDDFWARHIVDSAQLITLAPDFGNWLDLGSGAGFPGLIVATVGKRPVTLVESRIRRVEFLREASEVLGVAAHVTIHHSRVETLPAEQFDIISARAFAPLPKALLLSHRFSSVKTRWVLPKGRSATQELESVRGLWQGRFDIVPSVTDPDSAIIVATDVRPGTKV